MTNFWYNYAKVWKVVVYFMKNKITKRVFDIIFSIFAIIIFTPVMVIVSILIKVISPKGGIIYKQRRLGLNGKEFEVYKFRTMIPNAEKKLQEMMQKDSKLKQEYLTYRKLKNDPRIIPYIGSFLRKTSLDELPQFFNVLKGDMSIIGPRPYIKDEFDNYPHYKSIIVSVKPGITGYWQTLSNRHDATFIERVKKDIEYIQNRDLWLDFNIFFKTIYVMIFQKGL